ncbi:MAG: phosphatidylglycerophosphatase A [Terriglobia bacterium]
MNQRRRGPAVWVATCGPIGDIPIAPGTFGSAVGLVLVAALSQLPVSGTARTSALAALAAVILAVGVWSSGKAEEFFGRKDPGQVVIDEVVGQMVTFLWGAYRVRLTWKWLLAGFVLFRIFDILKPPPARNLERLPGGWGIMMDDCAAGLYSLAVLLAFRLWLR